MRSYPRHHAGFTLVEVLVAIAIIAIISAIALPSLMASKAHNLENGGEMVVGLINQGREEAIATRSLTALVMVYAEPGSVDWNYRLFILMRWNASAAVWTAVTKWYELPAGVLIQPSSCGAFLQSPALAVNIQPPPFRGGNVPLSSCAYQVFTPSGSILNSNLSPPVLQVVQGTISGAAVTYTGSGGNTPSNYYQITLNRYAAIPKIDRP